MKRINKACVKYAEWKQRHNPGYKPWLYPEQNPLSNIPLTELSIQHADSLENIDESSLSEGKDERAEHSDEDGPHWHAQTKHTHVHHCSVKWPIHKTHIVRVSDWRVSGRARYMHLIKWQLKQEVCHSLFLTHKHRHSQSKTKKSSFFVFLSFRIQLWISPFHSHMCIYPPLPILFPKC